MIRSCISVVLPVYNEHANIAECLRGLWKALEHQEHEILVCYDFDQDSTLPAIAAMPDAPPSVRLVKNELGRGAANAIRAGFAAAQGDVVVTTMADLSDPPEVIPRMAAKIRDEGAAVVAGSRYMKGGSQSGGPLLKRVLSQTAGLSLRVFTGIGTLDATSNFRAYAKRFLERVQIESRAGFEIALELTIKAHMLGEKVAEVPSDWRDRSAGTSRFRMWKWMPNYLRWYWEAMAAPVFVFAVWAAMLWWSYRFVLQYGSKIPFWDDLEMTYNVLPRAEITWQWLWSLHNEHRIPLPRLVYVLLARLTDVDFRSGMFFQVFGLAFVALAMMLVVRRVRGRTTYTDAFFPLIWMHLGNCENLLMAFQISMFLPAMFGALLALCAVERPGMLTWRRSVFAGLCILALPLCGGGGLAPTPPWIVWLALAGWLALSSGMPGRKRNVLLIWGLTAAACALLVCYFIDFRFPENSTRAQTVDQFLTTTAEFLALSLGPAARDLWPTSGWFVLTLAVLTLALLVRVFWTRPAERQRASGLVCAIGSVTALAMSIGYARGGGGYGPGFAVRYVTLPATLLCCVYFAWSLYGSPATGGFVRMSLYAALAALMLESTHEGTWYGKIRLQNATAFAKDIDAGLSPNELAARHWQEFYPEEAGFADRLSLLYDADLPPFRSLRKVHKHPPLVAPLADGFSMLELRPYSASSPEPIAQRFVHEYSVLIVRPDGELRFDLPAHKEVVRGQFGLAPASYEAGKSDGVRFIIKVLGEWGREQVILDRTLDPRRTDDRGIQDFVVDLPPGVRGELVLITTNAPGMNAVTDYPFWTGVGIE